MITRWNIINLHAPVLGICVENSCQCLMLQIRERLHVFILISELLQIVNCPQSLDGEDEMCHMSLSEMWN